MKILQISQKCFTALGIDSEQSKHPFYRNYKILMGFVLLGYSLFGHLVYIIYVDDRFDKYIECVCATVAIVVITTCFASMVFGMSILFESIDNIESLIDTSECLTNWSIRMPISKLSVKWFLWRTAISSVRGVIQGNKSPSRESRQNPYLCHCNSITIVRHYA